MKTTLSLITLFIFGNVLAQKTANNFTVTDVHGHEHVLYDYLEDGKYVVLDFFYTTCGPCIYYSPQVNETFKNYGCNTADVVFIAIDYDDTNEEVIAYDAEYDVNFPSVSGKEGGGNAVCSSYGINSFPTLLIIKPNKEIAYKVSPPTVKVFDAHFDSLGVKKANCASNINKPLASAILVFPNPNQGQFTIDLQDIFKDSCQISIQDVNGKTIYSNIIYDQQTISLLNQPKGVYLIQFLSKNQMVVYKKILLI